MRDEERNRTLVACPACAREVSLAAETCPGCGARLRVARGRVWRRLMLVGSVLVAAGLVGTVLKGAHGWDTWSLVVRDFSVVIGMLLFVVGVLGRVFVAGWK